MDYFNKSNWSKNIGLRYLLGLTASLSLSLTAFEWKTYDEQKMIHSCFGDNIERLIDIPNNNCPPPPPPILTQPEIIETFDEETTKGILLDLTSEFAPDESLKPRTDIANYLPQDSGKVNGEELIGVPFWICGDICEVENDESKPNRRVSEIEEEETTDCFLAVEEPAEPEGGFVALYRYIGKNAKIPMEERRWGGDFKIYLQFVIERDGSISNIEVMKGDKDSLFTKSVVALLYSYPKWKPARQRGRPVRQRMFIPIGFNIS